MRCRIPLEKPFDKSVLNLCNLRRGLADGDFIEVVAETDSYFEIRAVVDSELKFVGAGPSWSEAIALADSWLARHGVKGVLTRRDHGWREKDAREAQVNLAHRLTGLPKDFLSSLKRGQVSDLITSARALLLPVQSIDLGECESVVQALSGIAGSFTQIHNPTNRSSLRCGRVVGICRQRFCQSVGNGRCLRAIVGELQGRGVWHGSCRSAVVQPLLAVLPQASRRTFVETRT